GPARLTELTGLADLGVLPMLRHDLPREEGALTGGSLVALAPNAPRVVLPRLPYGSNLDEFRLLPSVAHVRWSVDPSDLDDLDPSRDRIVLPGSKHVVADFAWLQTVGFTRAIERAAGRGVPVIGVCGGAMMLGKTFHDPDGVEGARPTERPLEMLGLLDLHTEMLGSKQVTATEVRFTPEWVTSSGIVASASGYEIRFGDVHGDATVVGTGRSGPVAWADGAVLATTVHGLFETPGVITTLIGPNAAGVDLDGALDATFDALADAVDEHLDVSAILRLIDA
ncbi:MAG: cobyric acid synthase CobQ, partial [Actinomycetota bacterium]